MLLVQLEALDQSELVRHFTYELQGSQVIHADSASVSSNQKFVMSCGDSGEEDKVFLNGTDKFTFLIQDEDLAIVAKDH